MRWFSLVLPCVVAACAPHVGPDGLAVGGPCVDQFDCVTGSFCLRSPEFPNGTCTTNCRTHADCRGESLCVEREAGVCLLACDTDEDCVREGYICRQMDSRGEPSRVGVCAGG